jgi:hypothetical protein
VAVVLDSGRVARLNARALADMSTLNSALTAGLDTGTYTLQSVALGSESVSTASPPITITETK